MFLIVNCYFVGHGCPLLVSYLSSIAVVFVLYWCRICPVLLTPHSRQVDYLTASFMRVAGVTIIGAENGNEVAVSLARATPSTVIMYHVNLEQLGQFRYCATH